MKQFSEALLEKILIWDVEGEEALAELDERQANGEWVKENKEVTGS